MRNELVVVHKSVELGVGVVLEGPCIIGKPPRGKKDGELTTRIGDHSIIRPFTTIYAGNTIAARFQTGQGVSIREGNLIGDDVSIGTNSTLEIENKIGNGTRIHSNCFLEMVVLGEHVFVGPHVVFTSDPHPMNCRRYAECLRGAMVEDLARIGGNVTVLPGVRIGKNSLVGAGSVVVDDVPEGTVVVGSPARVIKKIEDLKCQKGFFSRPYEWPPYQVTP